MPFVRGRVLPEVELAGRAKRFLDILIWVEQLEVIDARALDELDILRVCLRGLDPFVCDVRIWIPQRHAATSARLRELGIEHQTVPDRQPPAETIRQLEGADAELLTAIGTAMYVDGDCLVVGRREWLPFSVDVNDKLAFLVTDCTFLLPYSEVFSRGHDVPWAFGYKSWNAPWNAFYQLAEERTFRAGVALLRHAQERNVPANARETGRSLVFNRLQNLCFTRDRLLFYEQQRLVAKRAGWQRQRFDFEISYFLNFNYLLIYGAFDHAALFVSQLLALGLADRQVGARSPAFLHALQKKAPALRTIFTRDRTKEFLERVGYLRHYAAHRGSLSPSIVVQAPEREPTLDELDEDIRSAGLDLLPNAFPPGPLRDSYVQMLRNNARFARYEKGKILEGVVPLEYGNGKFGFINPLLDTPWNFSRITEFLDELFAECMKLV